MKIVFVEIFTFRCRMPSVRKGVRRFVAAVIFLLWVSESVIAGVPAADAVDDALTFSLGPFWHLSVSPSGDIYPPYIADLQRPGFGMMNMNIMDSEIPDAGKSRYSFMLGGQYGLLRLQSISEPAKAFQVDFYGAFNGQFDLDNSTDNIGWDGLYGIALYWANGFGLALKLAMRHDSSHVGDEYMERIGRLRINYTREEWAAGLSYCFMENFRIYGEGAYAFDMRNTDLQEPWRVQGGLEWEKENLLLGGRAGYYAAIDVGAAEELEWENDVTIQTGLVIPVRRFYRNIRIGLIYRNGRSLIGEFFQNREEWWGFGLWVDM